MGGAAGSQQSPLNLKPLSFSEKPSRRTDLVTGHKDDPQERAWLVGAGGGGGGGQEEPWPSTRAHLLCPRAGPARLPCRPLPRACGKRPRPEAPPGGPALRLCLLRTWRGLGFPSAKLGSPPTLTTERARSPERGRRKAPAAALLTGKPGKGRGWGRGQVRGLPAQVRARADEAGGGCLGPFPAPTPPSQRAGVRSAIPTKARLARCPGHIDRLAWVPASCLLSPGSRGAERVKGLGPTFVCRSAPALELTRTNEGRLRVPPGKGSAPGLRPRALHGRGPQGTRSPAHLQQKAASAHSIGTSSSVCGFYFWAVRC